MYLGLMKHARLFIFIIFLSCQPKGTSESVMDSVETETSVNEASSYSSPTYTPPPEIASTYQVSTLDFDALLLPGTTVYRDSTDESEIVTELVRLVPVSVLDKSVLMHPTEGDLCNQFPWFKVRFSDGDEGWAYGSKFIHSEQSETASFQLDNKDYDLYLGFDAGVGASNSEGLTGCNDYQVLYIQCPSDTTIHLIRYQSLTAGIQNLAESFDGWFSVVQNEGGGAKISTVRLITTDSGTQLIRLYISISYQEGGAEGYIDLQKTDSDFTIYQSVLIGADEGD
jgi:hypothetical protein